MDINVDTLTATAMRDALASGETTARELVSAYLRRIEEQNTDIHAYTEVFADAIEQADAADAARAAGKGGSLAGIPIAVKDNILVQNRVATAGSKMLEHYTAAYDATAIQALRDAGAVFIGRTNMDEFAMGASTENSAFGTTQNPRATDRVPGGSSGGSAAAVAMGGVPWALGSDTGGSIRQPASFCGVVGLKPTYGSVSRSGLIAMGSSLDVIGPITRTVSDTKLLFETIAGHDPKDSTSLKRDHYGDVSEKAQTIGVPRTFLETHLEADAAAAFAKNMERLTACGYSIVDIDLAHVERALAAYYIIMFAESSTNLARFDGVKYGLHVDGADLLTDYLETRGSGFGPEVRRRILLGTYVLSAGYYDAYYGRANAVRRQLTDALNEAFATVDAIAMPVAPSPAFRIGEKEDPLSMYLTDVFTVPANLSGIPALSVPGEEVAGLPFGLQFLAPHGGESRLFTIGSAFAGEHA